MGQFRDRMDDELRLRGYSASTRDCYVRCVRNFVRHFMRPPDPCRRPRVRSIACPISRACCRPPHSARRECARAPG